MKNHKNKIGSGTPRHASARTAGLLFTLLAVSFILSAAAMKRDVARRCSGSDSTQQAEIEMSQRPVTVVVHYPVKAVTALTAFKWPCVSALS